MNKFIIIFFLFFEACTTKQQTSNDIKVLLPREQKAIRNIILSFNDTTSVMKVDSNLMIFKYYLLSKNQILFDSIPINGHIYDIEDNKINEDSCWTSVRLYNKKYQIRHFFCDSAGAFGEGNLNFPEKINILGKDFFFGVPAFFNVENLYKFSFKTNKYLLLHCIDRKMIMSCTTHYWILFDITNKLGYKFETTDEDPRFINDFNNDGNLDYINYFFEQDTIKFFTLENKKFIHIPTNYIIVTHSEKQANRIGRGDIEAGELIDIEKSKWFFNLREK